MTDYYVAPIAGTGGAGTLGDPWKIGDLYAVAANSYTAGPALTALQPGDTLNFRGGSYALPDGATLADYQHQLIGPQRSGTVGAPITLRSYPGETAAFTLSGGTQPIFGGKIPTCSYVRFIGLQAQVIGITTPVIRLGGTSQGTAAVGCEVGYCDLAADSVSSGDNHNVINIEYSVGTWIHHNKIHGSHNTPSPQQNSSGITWYDSGSQIVEDNYIYDCDTAILHKDAGTVGLYAPQWDGAIYRRNWLTDCVFPTFTGPVQGIQSLFHVYDNVIDCGSADGAFQFGAYNTGCELYNNLIRGNAALTSSCNLIWAGVAVGQDHSYIVNIWNNVLDPSPATTLYAFLQRGSVLSIGGPTGNVNYFDYNVHCKPPTYRFNWTGTPQVFTLAQFQAQGLETHAMAPASLASVYDGGWNLLSPYATAGRYGDEVGPRYPVASILDATRYGPAAAGGEGGGGCPSILADPDPLVLTVSDALPADETTHGPIVMLKPAASFWFRRGR